MRRQEIIDRIMERSRELTKSAAAHDYEHMLRVHALVRRIGKEENADMLVLEAAALMHDLGRAEESRDPDADHTRISAVLAEGILKEVGFPGDRIDDVLYAISVHRYKNQILPETKEARILQDADKLDALGAIGIMRCFSFGGAAGRLEYDPEDPLCRRKCVLEDNKYSVDHFYKKLFRLKESISTPTARAIAEEREKVMRWFLEELLKEIKGER